jgi:hypothetical protein
MSVTAQRIAALVAVGIAIAIGLWCSGQLGRQSDARVEEIRAGEGDVEDARANVAAHRAALTQVDAAFERGLADDATGFGLPVPALATFRAPHVYAIELEDAIVLAPGKSWSSKHLSIEAVIAKVRYQQHGATVSANHTLARIENVAKVPVAYLVRLASADRGRCEVRGARAHNAIALRPGEVAEIVVCAGSGALRVEHVEVLELDELGHRYVSQLPAQAVGADDVTTASHQPRETLEPCRGVDATQLAQWIRDGTTTWGDVIDFFSRHDCHRFSFVTGYRRATAPLPSLPFVAEG